MVLGHCELCTLLTTTAPTESIASWLSPPDSAVISLANKSTSLVEYLITPDVFGGVGVTCPFVEVIGMFKTSPGKIVSLQLLFAIFMLSNDILHFLSLIHI